ncbi:MAG: transporter substrate-binding domain-containing protein [Pseudomonadota bacterium]
MSRPEINNSGSIEKRRLRALLFSLALAWLPAVSQAAGSNGAVDIMVEGDAPPWSKPDGTGYANDVVVAAFKEMGVKVNLEVVPYSRCKAKVLSAEVAACFNMGWLSEFQGRLKFASEPLLQVNADLFENIHKPLPRPAKNKCRLPPGTTVGIVRGYEYPPQTVQLNSERIIFDEAPSDESSLKKLAKQRFDAAIIMTNKLEPKNVKIVATNTEKQVRFAFNCGIQTGSIGFSMKHPRGMELYRLYEDGYRRIKSNGILQNIRERWFP